MKYFVLFLILIGLAGTVFALEPKTTDYFSNLDFEIYSINEQSHTFFIPYSITNSKINDITMDCPSRAMVIDIDPAKETGTLTIVLPRTLLDSRYGSNDDSFIILVDGQEIEYSEIEKNAEARVLNIPFFENSSQIEIIVTTLISQSDDPLKIAPCGEAGSDESSFHKVLSPLKQIKNGAALIDVQCKDGKVPAVKYDRMRVACVSLDTEGKLMMRGWATMRLAMPEDNISHALCNNYEGKWHQEYFGCRDITDFQCSLMGGELVDNLSICYNGICPDKLYSLCVTNPNLYIQYPNETEDDFRNRCGPSDTLRGPTPMPTECNSELIECTYVCGDTKRWLFFDEHGFEIDQTTAGMIVDRK